MKKKVKFYNGITDFNFWKILYGDSGVSIGEKYPNFLFNAYKIPNESKVCEFDLYDPEGKEMGRFACPMSRFEEYVIQLKYKELVGE